MPAQRVGQYQQRGVRADLGAQGGEAVAQALMHFLIGGVVGLADLAVAGGVAEKQGDQAAQPTPAHR